MLSAGWVCGSWQPAGLRLGSAAAALRVALPDAECAGAARGGSTAAAAVSAATNSTSAPMTVRVGSGATPLYARPGAIVDALVSITDNAAGLMAGDFYVTYDTSLLSLASADIRLSSYLIGLGWGIAKNPAYEPQTAKVTIWTNDYELPPDAGAETLLDLRFHALSAAGTSALTLTGNLNERGLTMSVVNGSIVVDNAAPTVTLTAPQYTSSSAPMVTVAASDDNPLPNGTAVALDVDLNHDGSFTGSELGYSTATLTGGSATVAISPALAAGTYQLRARASDQAGNQGSSALSTMSIVPTPTFPVGGGFIRVVRNGGNVDVFVNNSTSVPTYSVPYGSLQWCILGGAGDDQLTVDFSAGNPVPAGGLIFDGGAKVAGDSLVITGTSSSNTVSLAPTGTPVGSLPTIEYNNAQFFTFDLGAGSLDLGGRTATVNGVTLASGHLSNGALSSGSYAMQSGTVDVTLAGAGGLTKTTGGTLTLSRPNTYQGSTAVWGGTLVVANAEAIPSNHNLIVNPDASVIFQSDLGRAVALGLLLPGSGGGAAPVAGDGEAAALAPAADLAASSMAVIANPAVVTSAAVPSATAIVGKAPTGLALPQAAAHATVLGNWTSAASGSVRLVNLDCLIRARRFA
jgi:autotransporter-associated beta strand protein